MDIVNPDINDYVFKHTKPESSLISELIKTTNDELEYSQMLSGRVEGQFLSMLVKLTGAVNILEIGMFTGFSALIMAEALPEKGKLITCDVNEQYAKIARHFFERSSHGGKIQVRMGNALETIKTIQEPIDLAFIDADKENYPNYYDLILPKMVSGGLIVLDNVLWSGDVLNPKEPQGVAIDQLNKKILEDSRVENVMLTVRDGIHLVRKK